ncbi:uncharacterized protein KNAG_0H01110 [Huiozyma naganishii CBS 8797]|uniref:Uncharacterized protein n=1 Tax=Huiozyma naganishii (strain ATCC MYA-139 / BCRC 22969 / CBS 8797 / KCTC 17520 / NBRC 10181 / NCYC 3082 / Yp74L-3) TaxID=1071383 RepID=J7S8G6_HUIN7|nr:hypothetical protein KNAG_0H01110 [Kazachstania naganishii CBS 8797]CCK71524.1 hypothetical protein KNAG_0H01110 [Kazachstania naganishii CBS 8797]
MLREAKRKTSGERSKRQSAFFPAFQFSENDGGKEVTNSTGGNSVKASSSVKVVPEIPQRAPRHGVPGHAKKVDKFKRSTILLDKDMVRDYSLVMNLPAQPSGQSDLRSPSEESISSKNSVFSVNSCVRDILYDEIDEIMKSKENKYGKLTISKPAPTEGTKAMFIIRDNFYERGEWHLIPDAPEDAEERGPPKRSELDFF